MPQRFLVFLPVDIITHGVVCAGDYQKPAGRGAGGLILIGHSYRDEVVILSVDQQHRLFRNGKGIHGGALVRAYGQPLSADAVGDPAAQREGNVQILSGHVLPDGVG